MRYPLLIFSFTLINCTYAQGFPHLEKVLSKQLTKEVQRDSKWVFYADKANIEKVDNQIVKARFPSYELFQLTLTNYLGYHVNQATCLVLFDSLKSNILLIPPLWYSGISEPLVKLFIGERFDSEDSLLNFFDGLHDLMEIGSGYKFRNTGYTDSLITYDLGFFKGDSYTTGGSGTSSTLHYNQDGVWRKIIIDIKNLAVIRYTSINPKTNDKEIIE